MDLPPGPGRQRAGVDVSVGMSHGCELGGEALHHEASLWALSVLVLGHHPGQHPTHHLREKDNRRSKIL